MKWLATVGVAAALFLAQPAAAKTIQNPHPQLHPQLATMTFRLAVTGPIGSAATFWVAYGPLRGHFGIVQLHAAGHGVYSAVNRLPMGSRTDFSYIEGQGVVQTKFGAAPGGPTVVFYRTGSMTITGRILPLVRYSMPAG